MNIELLQGCLNQQTQLSVAWAPPYGNNRQLVRRCRIPGTFAQRCRSLPIHVFGVGAVKGPCAVSIFFLFCVLLVIGGVGGVGGWRGC